MGQLLGTNNLGGYFSNPPLSAKNRVIAQPTMKFRAFTDVSSAIGSKNGDSFLYDKISNIQTQGSSLTETSTVPKSNFLITQGSLTLKEFGNSIPYTFKVDKLSQLSVPDNIRTALRNDWAKVLDSAVKSEFVSADYKVVITTTASTTITSDGTATSTATGNTSDKNVRDVVDDMKIKNCPKRANGNYVAICSTNFIRGVYDFFEPKANLTTMSKAVDGVVGNYYGCTFIEETSTLSNSLGSASDSGEAVFFGADAVHEGMVVPEEFRADVPKDLGRDKIIGWYGLMGFQKTWDFTTDADCRIWHVTSA